MDGLVLPQNLDAEAGAIGGVLLDSRLLEDVIEIVLPEDFYDSRNKEIFAGIIELYKNGTAIDYLTVTDWLTKHQKLERAGGSAYIAGLINLTPSATNTRTYANIVKEKALLRAAIQVSTDTIQEAYAQSRDASDILERAESRLPQSVQRMVGGGYTRIQDVLTNSFKKLDALHQSGSSVRGIPTGFTDVDEILSGLNAPDLIILAARPGMGKTSLALNLARNISKAGHPVVFFSLEMSQEQLVDRLWSMESNVKLFHILTGQFNEEQEKALLDANGRLGELPIFIDDCASLSSLEFRTKARRLVAKEKVEFIIIDYLQLMTGATKTDNKNYEVSEISRSLKMVAKELNVPILALSQLNRSVEYRQDPVPQLSDLRDSGSVEQDADIVMFIHRSDVVKGTNTNLAQLYIKKHRNGPLGTVNLRYDPSFTSFYDLEI